MRFRPIDGRVLSVVAGTIASLACGTNYVYSAWAPQFQQRLKLSSTEINLIGSIANVGMYATGIPSGMMVDKYGPRSGVVVSVVAFMLGYFPLAKAFDAGPGAFGVPLLCFFSFFTGVGSNAAFASAIKVAALNYPATRGTATAFPLAAFGLSAFAFATVALAFPHDTSHFLLLLAGGTVVLPAISYPFIKVYPHHSYQSLSHDESVQALHHRRSLDAQGETTSPDTGSQQRATSETIAAASPRKPTDGNDPSDSLSLLSEGSSTDMADLEVSKSIELDTKESPRVDIRGFALLRTFDFYQQFILLGLLCGVGLMTINNIGNDATALWRHYDASVDSAFIAKRQVMHVSIISVCSFSGRLLSGIGSDVLHNKYKRSRFWCLLVSSVGFALAQLLALIIEAPMFLVSISSITGFSYGLLFGVYPAIVAHTFGIEGLSQNWGTMCLAPVIGGNVYNIFYGTVYDGHSIVEDNGDRECIQGNSCYRTAYEITFFSTLASIVLCIWSIYHEHRVHRRVGKNQTRSDHDRIDWDGRT